MRQLQPSVLDESFSDALKKAEKLRLEHVAAFRDDCRVKITTTDHYKKFGEFLLERQHRKCAYCESWIENQPGDVEHYRPKGRVADENGKVEEVDVEPGVRIRHPGYFWLAYDIDNLLMSCIDCNRQRTHKDSVTGEEDKFGKADIFPIAGKRAWDPEHPLKNEQPLLLHPVHHQPTEHLLLDPESGLLSPKTEAGEMTIAVLGLNRENLRKNRVKAFLEAEGLIAAYVDAKLKGRPAFFIEEFEQSIYDTVKEITPYCLARNMGLDMARKKMPEAVDIILKGIVSTREEMAA